MINLLPPELKQSYKYARRNSSLLHLAGLFGVGIAGMIVIVAAGLVYLQQASHNYAVQSALIEASLKEQKQDEVDKEAKDISSSLKLAVQVLSQEVLFSQLLKQLAVVTPSNASLSGISISQLQGGVDIVAKTIDYDAATQLQINLADPANKIFEKADIVSITCGADTGGQTSSKYPCTVTIRALFASDNPFLFISSKAGS